MPNRCGRVDGLGGPLIALAAALALLLAACGDATAEISTPENTPETTTTSEPTTVTTAGSSSTSSPTSSPTSTSAPEQPAADVVISGALSRGELVVDDRRVDVPLGSTVLITFESDEVEHLHLHGYDLLLDLEPGQPAELTFVADSPGSFEVELEDSGRFLFELLVR